MNFEIFFYFAFESYITQEMSIYNCSQYITKSLLYLPNTGSFTPLFASIAKNLVSQLA
jgi:hypothetical protein